MEGHEPRVCRTVERPQLPEELVPLGLVKDADNLDGQLRLRGQVHGAPDERASALADDFSHFQIPEGQPSHTCNLRPIYRCDPLPVDNEILLDKGAGLRERKGRLIRHVHRPAPIELNLHCTFWRAARPVERRAPRPRERECVFAFAEQAELSPECSPFSAQIPTRTPL